MVSLLVQQIGHGGDAWRQCFDPGAAYRVGPEPVLEMLRSLYARGFLVAKGVDELQVLRASYEASGWDAKVLGVNLLCTLGCNLRCPYCFEGKVQSASGNKTMSRATEDAVARYLQRSLEDKRALDLCWFGGEPLLAMHAIERISGQLVPFCKREGIKYQATLITNGTLLRRDVLPRLKKCKVGAK